MATNGSAPPAHTNRLAAETSPYLLQHAHNPVDWYPWGPEALAKAKAEDKPIFLSIGYAACHWCHVMERESFEDDGIAEQLARDFVAIKVDREERPDLDAVYMNAVQAMTGQGGWPMSVFLTPDGRPFFGGTYFPNVRRYGMPSFRDVLDGVARAWREDRPRVEQSASELAAALASPERQVASPPSFVEAEQRPASALLAEAVAALERSFDARHGGWGGAPKFPAAMAIDFLLREHADTGDQAALAMARRTLDAMADGGIYDHLGGGFARYSTDRDWLVPHFEKMLYDNALLVPPYLHAWQLTGAPRYRQVVEETLDFLVRDMRTADGALASSLDADTDGVEGATYVWRQPEIDELLGPEAPLFAAAYGVTPEGNWEGTTILSRVASDEELAIEWQTSSEEVAGRLAAARATLLAARQQRPQPARDDKALAGWNGLAIAALAEAGRVLDRGDYVEAAAAAADVLLGSLLTNGRLRRSWKDGRASADGVLEDHANLAAGLLALYEATADERWFVEARRLTASALARFTDPAGGFFDTADDHERLFARPKDLQDNALPSGNAQMATVLLRIAALTGETTYRGAADRALALIGALPARYPTAFGQWLIALGMAARGIDELAVVGGDAAGRSRLLAVANERFRPRLVTATSAVSATTDATHVPLLLDRPALEGKATAYLCRGFACRQPVTDPEALRAQLEPVAA